MRVIAILAVLGLSACVSDMTQRDGGLATYDAIKAAQAECEAKGKVFRLQRNGQAKYLDDYACENK